MGWSKADKQERSDYQDISNEELLLEYKKNHDFKIKQELVMRYVYMVKNISIQMRDVYIGFAQVDDIINEGVLVIMNGIEKFDIDKNVKFETYISKRIRGMIIDMARKQDWIPRSVRKSAKEIDNAAVDLYCRLGRYASPKEMAEYLKIPIEKYQDIVAKTNLFNILSLDAILSDTAENKALPHIISDNDEEQPEKRYLDQELKQTLTEAIGKLKENEQKVISLYYIEELNMKEIAQVMQLSEPRISQIHSSAIQKLKVYMSSFIAS